MKRIEYLKEIKAKSLKDIYAEVTKLRAELVTARLDLGLSKLKNPHQIKALKRKIALSLTLICEKVNNENK